MRKPNINFFRKAQFRLFNFSAILFMLIVAFTIACQKDSLFERIITPRGDGPVIDMSYSIETVKFHRKNNAQNNYDIITLTPDVDTRTVRFKIFEDGSLELESNKASRSFNFTKPPKPLADNYPDVEKFTFIDEVFSAYDSLDNLLFQESIPIEDYSWLIDSLKSQAKTPISGEITNTLLCSQIGTTNLTLANLITFAQASGGTVINHGNGHVTIRITAEQAGHPAENNVAVLLINQNIERVLGTVLYDNYDNFISSIMYRYSDDTNHFLEGIQIVTLDTLPSGNVSELVNESTISDLSVSLNIP